MSSTCAEAPEKPTSSPVVEDRDHDRDVGRVGGAAVRVVVEDDVALVDVVAEDPDHVLDDLRHRAHEHRRRVRLGQLVALRVEDAGAEVLGLADDRRVRHAVEDAGHLLGDRRERAADHAHQDRRREARGALGLGARRGRAVDDDVAVPVDLGHEPGRDDRGRVVLLDHGRPVDAVAGAQPLALVERCAARVSGLPATSKTTSRSSVTRARRVAVAALELGRLELVDAPDADGADVDDLDLGVEAVAVLGLVRAVEGVLQLLDPGVVDLAGGHVEAHLVALARVAAVGEPPDEPPVLRRRRRSRAVRRPAPTSSS